MNEKQKIVYDRLNKLRLEEKDHFPMTVIYNFDTYLWNEGVRDEKLHEAFHTLTREEEYEVLEKFINTRDKTK